MTKLLFEFYNQKKAILFYCKVVILSTGERFHKASSKFEKQKLSYLFKVQATNASLLYRVKEQSILKALEQQDAAAALKAVVGLLKCCIGTFENW